MLQSESLVISALKVWQAESTFGVVIFHKLLPGFYYHLELWESTGKHLRNQNTFHCRMLACYSNQGELCNQLIRSLLV